MRGQNDGTFRLFTEKDWGFFRNEQPHIYRQLLDALAALKRVKASRTARARLN